MSREGLASKLLVGSIAGIVGTAAMSAAMRRLFRTLPPDEQYPLPPREITERMLPPLPERGRRDATLASHFAFGAAAGGLVAASGADRSNMRGVGAALAIWIGSYMGWVPGFGLLRPMSRHPLGRNLLMLAAHIVWGTITAATVREMRAFQQGPIAGGPLRDASKRSRQ